MQYRQPTKQVYDLDQGAKSTVHMQAVSKSHFVFLPDDGDRDLDNHMEVVSEDTGPMDKADHDMVPETQMDFATRS